MPDHPTARAPQTLVGSAMPPKTATVLRQIRALLDSIIEAPDAGPAFRDVLGAYESSYLPTLAENTQKSYRAFIGQLRRSELVERRLGEITAADVLAAAELSPRLPGQRAIAKQVGRTFQWAIATGLWTGEDPAASIKSYKAPVPDDALDEHEIRRLIEALADPDHGELWRRRTVLFLALQPWRSGEALELLIENVNGSWAFLPKTKTGPSRRALSTQASELIARASEGRDRGLVFRPRELALHNAQAQVRHTLRRTAKAAGLTTRRLHALRHSGATNLQALGVSIADVGALLGHTNTASTMRYLHRNARRQQAGIEQLAAALRSVEPSG